MIKKKWLINPEQKSGLYYYYYTYSTVILDVLPGKFLPNGKYDREWDTSACVVRTIANGTPAMAIEITSKSTGSDSTIQTGEREIDVPAF
jgi:hypothetical protein